MNQAFEVAAGIAALCAAAWLVLYPPQPRPKPEPPPVTAESKQEAVAETRVTAEPEPQRAQEQRSIDNIAKDVRQAERDIQEIKAAIRLQQASKAAAELPKE